MSRDQSLEYWNQAAARYAETPTDTLLTSIYEPVIDDLLGDLSGRYLFDAGCGEGAYARKAAARGAFVTAIDGSVAMIDLARRRATSGHIRYAVADLTEPLPFAAATFDAVLANMVLMDIPRIDVAVGEFARTLKRDGRLVLSVTHPCFFLADWISDGQGAKAHKAVTGYLSPTIERLHFWGPTLHFHRPLSQYFRTLAEHRLCVDALEEPAPSNDLLEQHPELDYHRRIPSFVVMRALKERD